MKCVVYRSLELLETGTIVDSFRPIGRMVARDGRYVVLNNSGYPRRLGSVGNSFLTPEEALEAIFAWRHPEFIEGYSR